MVNTQETRERWMKEALKEAHKAAQHGDVPVGAVLVIGNEIVGRGRNKRVLNNAPLAHAEIVALEDAAANTGNWRFDDATLYVTLEPCPMCAGAIVQARVANLVYGARDEKGGACHSLYQITQDPRLNHRLNVDSGTLETACADVLREFFAALRSTNR